MIKRVSYFFLKALIFIVRKTPKKHMKLLATIISIGIYYGDFFRKKIVIKNIEIAFPALSEKKKKDLVKRVYYNFIFYFFDMLKKITVSKEELKKEVTIINEKYIHKALSSNKPIVFMTAHFGNWEFAPKVIGAFYTPMLVLARNFENQDIENIFNQSRNSFNIETISKDKAAKSILRAFKEKRSVAILIDQHSSSPLAVDVDFFNQKVKFNRAITTLAKKFNVVVVPIFTYRKDNRYHLEFLEPRMFNEGDTLESFTQWQASTIESMIRKYPAEYYWFHKRFKNIPEIYK